jgi:hypothetical protein
MRILKCANLKCGKFFGKNDRDYFRLLKRGQTRFFDSRSCCSVHRNTLPHIREGAIRRLQIRNAAQVGPNNPNWKGGFTGSEYQFRMRAKYPERFKAREKVRKAVERGVLHRPFTCSDCKLPKGDIEAHHEDYSKPLQVLWVCRECHEIRDKQCSNSLLPNLDATCRRLRIRSF